MKQHQLKINGKHEIPRITTLRIELEERQFRLEYFRTCRIQLHRFQPILRRKFSAHFPDKHPWQVYDTCFRTCRIQLHRFQPILRQKFSSHFRDKHPWQVYDTCFRTCRIQLHRFQPILRQKFSSHFRDKHPWQVYDTQGVSYYQTNRLLTLGNILAKFEQDILENKKVTQET